MPLTDRDILRPLAARWMELACLPVMPERKQAWTALKDLHPLRPMMLFEVWTVENFVAESELECSDPFFREVELLMRRYIRQVELIGDDFVVEPCWRLFWDISSSDFGVEVIQTHSSDAHGGEVGFSYNHPLKTPQDVDRLKPREFKVDRAQTLEKHARLSEAIGDLCPVVLWGTGSHHAGLTGDLFKLIGNDNLLMWTYDAPEALQRVMAYLRDDRLSYYRWLQSEGLLGLNNYFEFVGSGSPGLTTRLPAAQYDGTTHLQDLWVWMESQETTMISPTMFKWMFLPYMAEVCREFGLVYYGCCEPVHDRWDSLIQAIPHIAAVSISPWCDQKQMGAKLGKKIVYSRKPKPWLLSGAAADWDGIEQDFDETLAAARDGCLEIICRDVYRVADHQDLRRWGQLLRSKVGGR